MPNEEDRKWLYGQFKDNGYDTGSYEDFVQSLDNDEDFEWWHNEATSLGLEVGDLAEFGSLFRTPKQETAAPAVEGEVPTNFDDQPDMRPLNDRARKRAEKEQKKAEKEQQTLTSAPRKDYASMSPQERRKAFNEQFQQRQMEKAEANPEAWKMEQKAIEENNELARQDAKTEKALNVPNYGTSGAYSAEEADLAAREYAEIAPELKQFDARLNDFNQKYGPLEDKIKQINEGKLQLSPEEYKQLQSDYEKYKKESEGLSLIAKKYDSVLNSAPGREYKDISERLTEIANGPKSAKSAYDYSLVYAELQRNPIYRASLGADAPSEDEINAGLLQGQIAYLEEEMKTAKGDEKKGVKKAFSDAKAALYANPWYRKQTEAKIAENKAENETIGLERAAYVQKLREGYKAQGIDPQYYWQMEKGDPELQRLDAAAHMHDDAIREYEKPTKYDDSKGLKNVGKGFGKWASDTDNWSFGIEGFVEDIAVVRPVLEKVEKIVGNVSEDDVMTEGSMKALEEQLTPGELAVLDAYFEKVGAVSAKGADTSIGYQIGQGIGDMVTLGLEMIATGGAGGAVRGVAEKGMKKGLVKLLGKRAYRKAAQSGAGKVALWAASKVPADVAETLVRLPFMPSTYKAIGEGAIELDSDYKTRDFMEYAPEKAYDQFVEQLTEVSNGFAFPLIGKVVKTPGMQKFVKGMLGDEGARTLRAFMERGDIKLLDDAMIGSFGGEWEEELLGAFIHSITDDPKALSDFFSAEQQLVLLGTLAPLPLSRGTVGGVQLAVPAAKAGVAWSRAEKELNRLGFDEGRIARLKEVLDNATVPEAAREIMSAYKDSVEGFMVAEEADNVVRGTIDATGLNWQDHGKLYGLLGEYLWAAQQKRAAGLMAEIQRDQKVAQKRAELESRLGGAFTHEYHSANGDTFEVVERNTMVGPDGNPVNIFITSENYNDSGEKSYVTEDGSRRGFVSRENLVSDYGSLLEADRYFAQLVMQDAEAQAAQGMVNEAVVENRSLREQVEMLPEISFNGQKGTIARATEDGAVFVPDDETQENIPVTWAELAEQNGIAVPDVPTPAEDAEAVAMAEAARYQQKQDIADGFTAAMQSNADLPPEVDTDEGHAVVTGIISNTIVPEAGTAQFTVLLDNGRRSVTTSIPIESILSQITPATTTEVPAEAPVEAPAAEAEEPAVEEPVEEAPKIPVDKKGNPIYDAPGVTIEDAIEDIYSTPGVSDEMGDQYIREMAAEAEKGRNPKRGKMNIKEWGEATSEANRKADFWKQMKEVADANTAARKEDEKKEAERQTLIDKYGVDTSNFDLTPQSLEEAVAAYLGGDSVGLINLDDAIRETLGKRKDNRVPTELFKHLGQYGILTKKGGSSVQAVADDIVRDFYGDLDHDDQADEARDYIINFLLNSTKKEMREFIFNNRLDEARKLAEYAETNQEEEAQEPEAPAEEPVVEEPKTEETTEEVTEDLPEEEATPEAPVVEEPEAEPVVETPETETEEEPAEEAEETENKEENAGKSEEKTVTSQEEESAPKKEGESTYGSSNKVVSKARYEELRKKMLEKLKGQMNAGFDPEIFAYGVEMAAYHIEAGARKFIEFAKNIINDLGDAIRPYLKAIYNGARDLPGMEEIKNEMTPASEVEGIDINADFNALSDEQDNTDVQQGDGGVSGTDTDSDGQGAGGESGTGDESADGGNAEEDNDAGGDEGGSGSVAGEGTDESGGGPGNEGTDGTAGGGRRGGRKANDGKSTRKGSGRRGGSRRGENEGADGVGRDADVEEETEEQKEAKAAKAEQEAYDAEKERIKGETDTNSLKKLFNEIKEKLTGLTDKFDEARAKLAGQLRAVRERLQELFSKNVNKSEALAQEKVPYSPVSDPTGEHAIGSVVPSGSADYMRDAIKRLEKEVGKPVAEFVMEELGYASLDEMFTTAEKEKFTGLSSEQVDAVGLAIQQIKTGRIFIVGDMTGVGKGRVGAALIRWGHRHGKKVIFCTEQPNLFTAMYEDINDIGGLDRGKEGEEKTKGKRKKSQEDDTKPLPFIINNAGEANITDDEDNVVVRHSNETQRSSLFTSGKDELPPVPGAKNKGKKYDFVMTTYSQLQATEEEEEGTSDKVKKKNERNTKGRQRIQWLKQYAKDAVVIMDESHTAAGTESTRGKNALKLVDAAQGVMFMSATFAKTPEAMGLYAVRSSMNEAQISREQLIRAISDYGIPMQEILSATLYKTGEYVRRERDFDGVKTNWCQPEEIYTSAEIETARNLSDYTTGTINDIIDFQRRYVDPIIRRLNKDVADTNRRNKEMFLAGITDSYTEISYSSTSYAGQVSNVVGMMLFAIKAKKAADMAIEQIKRGEKPVIAVDNTLGAYVDEIEGDVESADFGTVLKKGLAFALKYQMTTKKFVAGKGPHGEELRNKPKEVKGDRVVEKYDSIEGYFGEAAEDAIWDLSEKIVTYGKETLKLDLSLSPIDYIKKRIEDAGYKCGEITKRQNALVQNEDGTWTKKPLKHNKKEVIRRFNGGKANSPLPKEETYDAVIMNRSGATGNSMHASRKFGDQRPRKMIILQAAKDPNNEVQIRGRIDRTGQVHRGEYFYIISPIPAEKKITMMLKQKLASLDAQSVGTENVSSNKVDAEDMDNKYGDEVAKEFLAEHQEINLQLDRPITQVFNRKTREMEWKGRPGLLYDLMKGMQRMTCVEQEMILQELEEAYSQKIEYLNQNGINDLATTTMDLEATTIDKAIMVKGKNNEAMSEFAHDTTIERVETNVLRKPLRSEDIVRKEKELGVFEKHEKTNSYGEKEDVSYGEYIQTRAQDAAKALREEKRRKQDEAEKKLADDIRVEFPREEGETEASYEERIYNDPRMATLRSRNEQERVRHQQSLQEQLVKTRYATTYLKPGYVYLVPLNESDDAQTMYGRFMGFKAGKDGRPNSIEAVFATKDSRAQVSIPVVGMKGMIERIANTNNPSFGDLFGKSKYDYESEEARIKFYDEWWDKMIPEKTARSVRYMITGNILQAVGQLNQHRGMIVTFTRKDAETGEITIDKGLLLAEDFDPENFMVRTEITKEDVWNNAGEFRDTISHIAVFRDGNKLRVKFYRERNSKEDLSEHDINDDEEFKALCEDGQIIAESRDELHAVIPEENAAEALKILYRNYGFTQGHLLILPDSTDKPDRIVPTGKSYDAVINELQPKYRCWSASSCQSEINKLLKTYKMDINNEDVKTKIRELVQLRQAYLRKSYCKIDTPDLAWHIVISEQEIAQLERPVPNESPEDAKKRKDERQDTLNLMEAFREELASREPMKGHMKHFKQGKIELSEIIKTFKEFNKDKENARIAEKVFAVMKKLNVNIFMDENATDNPRKRQAGGMTAGDYLMYNWRFMNEDTIPDQLKANTILHEMCHTMTAYVLEAINNGATSLIPGLVDAGKQADALYWAIYNSKAFTHNAGDGPTSGTYQDYGKKDVYEMLAETGANQRFRDDLATVKVSYKEETTTSFGKTRTSFEFTDVTESKEFKGETMTALEAAMDILERMIDGFTEDGYKKMWTGTGYGQMGYSSPSEIYRRGESIRSPIDRASAISSVVDLANKLGVKFKEDSSLGAKGSFDPKTGQIKINVDRHADAEDLQITLLHEAVAHYGLRKLLGKDFASEIRDIYEKASPAIKERIDAIAKRDGLSTEVATEEYLAGLAEDGRFDADEENIWRRLWNGLVGWLRDHGFNIRLTDADMRALLYASYRNLQTRGAVAQAHHISVMNALRKAAELSHEEEDNGPDDGGPSGGLPSGESDENTLNEDEEGGLNDLPEEVRQLAIEQDTDELYRRSSQGATAQTAAEMYGNNVRTIGSAVHEVLVDEYHPIDILMDALASESKSKIKDDERVSDMMRETGGKAMQEIREYDKKFLQPMWTAVGEFRKNTGSSIKDTETYIGLKSGLERNVVLAKRDAKRDYQAEYDAEIDKINQEEKEKKKFLDRQLKNGKISDVTYAGELTVLQQEMKQKRDDAETERQARFADIDTGTDKRYLEYRKKDYSAITAWAEKEDLQEAEQLAADYVADMESRAGASTVKEMWKRINAATKETLKFQYEHQILSRQQYQDISKMMDYYVPMRGFSEDTAEDLFNYYVTAQSNDFQATVLTAKGRKTWYEGPLGNIGAMHSSAIAQGVKNTAKLSLLDAVRRRPENTIATVTRAWFVKNGQKDVNGKDLYDVAYPQIPEGATRAQREAIVEQFEQDMKEAKERRDAYNSHREVDLHGGVVAFEKESHKNEHVVKVREGGKEYGIIINGNPAAAQALNGVRRSNGTGEKFLGIMRSWTRLLSSMFTTFSVPFWVSNFQRDHGQGLTNAFIRNNREYVGRYIKNRMRAIKLFPYIIGEESLDKAIAKGDPVAKLYKQYLDNGGPMGQNRIEDNEYFERKMKRFLDNSAKQGVVKGGQAVLNFIGGVGETIETITRFAVFMTSMEAGRPIHESVSDAKEISTNFARKGSGRSFSRDELDRMTHADGTKLNAVEKGFVNALSIGVEICRATIPFFNAAVQGLENKVTNYREHWGKTLLADGIYLMLGLGMKLLFGNAGGDDDKEKYSHTSDYLRRNNILSPLGNGVYAKWALPQEYRVMYALGDIIGSAFQREHPIEDLGADAFGALMQLSPIGAVTDEVAFSPENKKKAYETLITNASPGVIAPVLESIFNMDFKGARIYNEGFNENLRAYPGWTKALPTTGKEYVAAAKWLNEISGGNEVERGWININPAVVEHLVESYFSGPYQIVVRMPEAAVKVAKGEAAVRDVPLLNRIILNTNDNQRDALYSNMYYYFKELNTEAARIHSEYKGRPKEGKAADFYKSKEYQYMLVFKKYDSMERNLRKASKVMDEKGDKEAKEGYDKRLEDIHYKIAKECLDIYFNRNGKEEVK